MPMVSTRTKYKFSDGERVLCYEPDRTKAKVLYDSKVLEVKVGKDERGRKTVEYLIHFQGWNSSWDRCVSEDFVLKDTEENRKLQRDLAERAQLQLGAYLYRKDHKKKKPNTLSERVFEASNSCSSQEAGSTEDREYLTSTDDDKDSSVDTDDSLEQKVPLDFSPSVRAFLDLDCDLINRQHKLVKLPASPTVVQILEGYVRYFSSRVLRRDGEEPQRQRSKHTLQHHPPEKGEELDWVCARVNLCKETVDGLRICFDYYLGSQLLYNSEKLQYEEMQSGQTVYYPAEKQEPLPEYDPNKIDDPSLMAARLLAPVASEVGETDRRRSLRSHKDPIQEASSATGANGVSKLTTRNLSNIGAGNLGPNNCSAPSSSSNSSCYGPSSSHGVQIAGAGQLGAELAKLMDLTHAWRLVPESYLNQCPQPPSTVYGAIHLARLFVKLPSFLYAANLPEKENQPRFLSEQKFKLLLHHLNSFLKYLESKEEWFSEENYIDNFHMEQLNRAAQ